VAVVDDEENLRRSFARLSRAAGRRAITYGFAEALLADLGRPRPDCLVLDVQLPGMSGLELQRQLGTEGCKTEILLITGHDNPRSREQAYAMGCSGCFRKSDSGRKVLNTIKRVVARRSRSP
jgi:FixJ family two-component response regulator